MADPVITEPELQVSPQEQRYVKMGHGDIPRLVHRKTTRNMLGWWRGQDERFKDVADDELVEFVGDTYTDFLQDKDIKHDYLKTKQLRAYTAGLKQGNFDKSLDDMMDPLRAVREKTGERWSKAWQKWFSGSEETAPTWVKGIGDAIEMVPTIAQGTGLTLMGVPAPLAFGGTMGGETLVRTGDLGQAQGSAALGAVIPGAGKAGQIGAAKGLEKMVEKGLLSANRTTVQKAVEVAGGQAAIQALIEAVNIPAYMAAAPEERQEMFVRSLVANGVFLMPDMPYLLRKGPSRTQKRLVDAKEGKPAKGYKQQANDIKQQANKARKTVARILKDKPALEALYNKFDATLKAHESARNAASREAYMEAEAKRAAKIEAKRAAGARPGQGAEGAGGEAGPAPRGAAPHEGPVRGEPTAPRQPEPEGPIPPEPGEAQAATPREPSPPPRPEPPLEPAPEAAQATPEPAPKPTPEPEPPAEGGHATPGSGAGAGEWASYTPLTGKEVRGKWRVVELDELITSNKEGYDQQLQNRDREGARSKEQVAELARKLQAERLRGSELSDSGSPIVDEGLQVLSGNGRTFAIAERYGAGNAEAYRSMVEAEAAALGVDASGMRRPVLVRQVDDYGGLSKTEFAVESNKDAKLGLSTAENAATDARLIAERNMLRVFAPSENGDVLAASNREFLKQFVDATGDRGSLTTRDGEINRPAVKARVESALLTLALGPTNRKVIGDLLERADALNIKNQANGLMLAAPHLTKHSGGRYDLGDVLAKALERLVDMKDKGETFEEYTGQVDFFSKSSTIDDTILGILAEARSTKQVAEPLIDYAAKADKIDLTTDDMFGAEPATREELIQLWHEEWKRQQAAPEFSDTGGSGQSSQQAPKGGPPAQGLDGQPPKGGGRGASTAGTQRRLNRRNLSQYQAPLVVMAANAPKVTRKVFPLDLPEIVRIATKMMEQAPKLRERMGNALGRFTGRGRGEINIQRLLMKDPEAAIGTLSHEVGHLIDYLPEATMTRGNIFGRLGSLRSFLKTTFPLEPADMAKVLSKKDRGRLRRRAEKLAEGDKEAVPEIYRQLLEDEMTQRGLVDVRTVREELINLSTEWRGGWADADPAHQRYRESSPELYADALSALLVDPAFVKAEAPTFYDLFFNHLEAKAEFKDLYFGTLDLLDKGPEAVSKARSKERREGYKQASEELMDRIQARKDAYRSMAKARDFITQYVDMGEELSRRVREYEKATGKQVPLKDNPREAWEKMLLADNKNLLALKKVMEDVVNPLEESGLTLEDLGEALELQRILGGTQDVYKGLTVADQLDILRERYGAGGLNTLDRLHDDYLKAEAKAETQAQRDKLRSKYEKHVEQLGMEPADFWDRAELVKLAGTRSEIGNPGGELPRNAAEDLAVMEARLGPERWRALQTVADQLRSQMFATAREATAAGIISQKVFDTVIMDNAAWYAPFRGVAHVDTYVSPTVRQAMGSFGKVENPFHTLVLKMISMNNLIMTQRAKTSARDFIKPLDPAAFQLAETRWTSEGRKALDPPEGMKRLMIMEDGRRVDYDVDPYIATAFEKFTPVELSPIAQALNVPWQKVVYPLIIKYNPAFQLWNNHIRDRKRTWRNLGAMHKMEWWRFHKNYLAGIRTSWRFSKGTPDPLWEEMLEAGAMGTPVDTFNQLNRTDAMGEWLQRYRIMAAPEKSRVRKVAMAVPRFIELLGTTQESLSKVAAYKSLREMGLKPEDIAPTVRNYAGTPNFKVKGQQGNVMNAYLPFSNIFLQGYRADARIATNPKTAGGWWFRYWLTQGVPAMIQGLAAGGALGPVLQQYYEGFSEYDKTNKQILPLGVIPGGEYGAKSVGIMFPNDEAGRLISAITYKAAKLAAQGKLPGVADAMDAASVGAGLVPSVTPVLETAGAWKQYATGQNPVGYRNQPVIPRTEFEAGGLHSAKRMLYFTADNMGLSSFYSYNTAADTTTELVMGAVPGFNRALKITDYGHREAQMEADQAERKDRARWILNYGPKTQALKAEYNRLRRIGQDARNEEQEMRYLELSVWQGLFSELDEAFYNAKQAGASPRELRRIQADMEKGAAAYSKARKDARQQPGDFQSILQLLGPSRAGQ